MPDSYFNRRSFLLMGASLLGLSQVKFQSSHSASPLPYELKFIDAGDLNVCYIEEGPVNGPAVVLLHGWPYDIHTFANVIPKLVRHGFRVVVPYLRGFGKTHFISDKTFRTGQQSAFACDTIALMDSLGIGKAIVAGVDWGARTANIMAILWPQRTKAMVSVSGYLVGNPQKGNIPLRPSLEFQWWYQYYFATERGRLGYDKYRFDFAKLIWTIASPKWNFDDETFRASALALENPDHIDIVIHNYRWRLGLVPGDAKYHELERKLSLAPMITVPTITMEGDANGAPNQDPTIYREKFTGQYAHRTIRGGIGHNLPQEAPSAFVSAILDADQL